MISVIDFLGVGNRYLWLYVERNNADRLCDSFMIDDDFDSLENYEGL